MLADAAYTMLNLADETAAVPWPIPLERAKISDKDRAHPRLADVVPVAPRQTVIVGAGGQLGMALQRQFPTARLLGQDELDLADPAAVEAVDLTGVGTVLNAAAFTAVDAAETPEGRVAAWATNATGVAALARACARQRVTLVHYSSDYVFDGTADAYDERAPLAPLGVYGQSKAAGDLAVTMVPRHYLLRTSWVVVEGKNFVRTMQSLAERGVSPSVVDDQVGRLTFTEDLARATAHLLGVAPVVAEAAPTGGGPPHRRPTAPTTSPAPASPPPGMPWRRRSFGSPAETPPMSPPRPRRMPPAPRARCRRGLPGRCSTWPSSKGPGLPRGTGGWLWRGISGADPRVFRYRARAALSLSRPPVCSTPRSYTRPAMRMHTMIVATQMAADRSISHGSISP